LSPKQQEELKKARDIQLERAEDLLKGILIYTHHAPPNQKIAAKPEKLVAEASH